MTNTLSKLKIGTQCVHCVPIEHGRDVDKRGTHIARTSFAILGWNHGSERELLLFATNYLWPLYLTREHSIPT